MTDNDKTNSDNPVPQAAMVVLKYEFDLGSQVSTVEMPEGAEILHSHSNLLWALVDKSKPLEKRKILCVKTGEEIVNDLVVGKHVRHIGSSMYARTNSVLHVFEVTDVAVVELTPELKRFLRGLVEKRLRDAENASASAGVMALMSGGSVSAPSTEWLQRLDEQLR